VPAPRGEPVKAAPAPNRVPALVAYGIGAAGFVASAIFAGLSLSEKGSLDADPACRGTHCPSSYDERVSRMVRFADLSTVGVAVGIAGAGAGTVLLVTAGPASAGAGSGGRVQLLKRF